MPNLRTLFLFRGLRGIVLSQQSPKHQAALELPIGDRWICRYVGLVGSRLRLHQAGTQKLIIPDAHCRIMEKHIPVTDLDASHVQGCKTS